MMLRTKVVSLELKTNENVAREVAQSVMLRANPHQSEFSAKRLDDSGINVESMTKYFLELAKAVAEFWQNTKYMDKPLTLKPHEMRGLYLPVMYGVIFSSIGNMTVGNYEYVLKAKAEDKPDAKFLIEFSAKLENVRDILKGAEGQVGNRSVQPQTSVMMSILSEISDDYRTAQMLVRDGVQVDTALAGLSTLVGLSLVEQAYTIMYTGVEEVNFRQLTDTLMEKGLMAVRKPASSEA